MKTKKAICNFAEENDFQTEDFENENDINEQFNFELFKKSVIDGLKIGKPFLGKNGTITPLIKQLLEGALEAEMEQHLNTNNQNRRNGKTSKIMKSDSGTFELVTSRDRDGTFEPKIVQKRQTILNETLDSKILSLYGIGMSYSDIRSHIQEIYGTDISEATITTVTDKLLPLIEEWRSRPLESIYAILYLDAIFFKVKEHGTVIQKAIYSLIGIDIQGNKDILGFYIAESEGANFWLSVLTDLKNRGIQDILISCVDGLTGFPQAIETAFPKTEIQLCIIHQIRNSLKYITSSDKKEFMSDLKTTYQATTKDLAKSNLDQLSKKWKKYPLVIKSWEEKWEYLSTYFKYSKEIRKLIYTTNPIENYHRQLRKYTKSKGAFTSQNALFKLIYCVCQNIKKKWNMPIPNWALAISQLDIYFPNRIKRNYKKEQKFIKK